MINWNIFEETIDQQTIIDKVGMKNERETDKFLVLSKFTNFVDQYEPRFATIRIFNNDKKLTVEGMTGKIKVCKWTEINF